MFDWISLMGFGGITLLGGKMLQTHTRFVAPWAVAVALKLGGVFLLFAGAFLFPFPSNLLSISTALAFSFFGSKNRENRTPDNKNKSGSFHANIIGCVSPSSAAHLKISRGKVEELRLKGKTLEEMEEKGTAYLMSIFSRKSKYDVIIRFMIIHPLNRNSELRSTSGFDSTWNHIRINSETVEEIYLAGEFYIPSQAETLAESRRIEESKQDEVMLLEINSGNGYALCDDAFFGSYREQKRRALEFLADECQSNDRESKITVKYRLLDKHGKKIYETGRYEHEIPAPDCVMSGNGYHDWETIDEVIDGKQNWAMLERCKCGLGRHSINFRNPLVLKGKFGFTERASRYFDTGLPENAGLLNASADTINLVFPPDRDS